MSVIIYTLYAKEIVGADGDDERSLTSFLELQFKIDRY